jgi:AcrR family transcriptional regulator
MEAYNIRITKKPEERRKELIDIAEQLFIKKGYEQTAVSDIVKKVKVAQGTFYYYFNSKEEILDVIIEKYIIQSVEGLVSITNEKGPNAVEKLVKYFLFSSTFRDDKLSIMQYIHEERNAHLHLKFERQIPKKTVKPLAKIITQGIEEKIFHTDYPEETAKAFIGVSAMVLQGIYNIKPGSEEYKRKILATFYILEKMFGAKQGHITDTFKKIGGKKYAFM